MSKVKKSGLLRRDMDEKVKENKQRWTSTEIDSTIFMSVFLVAFIAFLLGIFFVPEFRKSEIIDNVMLLFSSTLGSMAIYFFGGKNGKTPNPPQGGQR